MACINNKYDNESSYTRQSYRKEKIVRNVQRITGRPSTKDYKWYVANNDMVNCGYTTAPTTVLIWLMTTTTE